MLLPATRAATYYPLYTTLDLRSTTYSDYYLPPAYYGLLQALGRRAWAPERRGDGISPGGGSEQ